MSENLPQKYKESFFSKVIRKIRKFFIKTKDESNAINSKIFENKKEEMNKNNMLDNLKVDIDTSIHTEYEKEAFMENLTNNPELLENFSNDRLEKILQYYLDENEKKKEILKKISA